MKTSEILKSKYGMVSKSGGYIGQTRTGNTIRVSYSMGHYFIRVIDRQGEVVDSADLLTRYDLLDIMPHMV